MKGTRVIVTVTVLYSILEMELWFLHLFHFSTYKSGLCHTISYIWLFLINFSSMITIRLLLGLTMLVTFNCENDPKVISLLKVKF